MKSPVTNGGPNNSELMRENQSYLANSSIEDDVDDGTIVAHVVKDRGGC